MWVRKAIAQFYYENDNFPELHTNKTYVAKVVIFYETGNISGANRGAVVSCVSGTLIGGNQWCPAIVGSP